MINGVTQAESQWVPVTQAQLSQITFNAGAVGSDNFYFYATDGNLNDYEASKSTPLWVALQSMTAMTIMSARSPPWIGENEEGAGLTLQPQLGPTHQWLLEL